ncbi:MAG: KH domain-containing protein, partial [Coriobacteriia bacterium]|nr:KH domain-containing protein [Coriobacteriia bacterium]
MADAEVLDEDVDVDADDGEQELPSDRVADLVEYLVVSLASDPDAISIEVTDGPESSLIEVHVASDDVGRVIGRHGRVIKAVRTLRA